MSRASAPPVRLNSIRLPNRLAPGNIHFLRDGVSVKRYGVKTLDMATYFETRFFESRYLQVF